MPEEQQGNTESQTAEQSTEQTSTEETQNTEQSTAEETQTGAPEEYTAFTVPEGQKVDEAFTGKFSTLAKELNLPQAEAQKMFDLGTEMRNADVTAQAEAWTQQQETWVEEAKADAEIGGAVFDANVRAAKQVLGDYGNEKFIGLLNESGYGSNPELIRFLVKVSKVVGEKKSAGGNRAEGDKSAADVLFPEQGKEG